MLFNTTATVLTRLLTFATATDPPEENTLSRKTNEIDKCFSSITFDKNVFREILQTSFFDKQKFYEEVANLKSEDKNLYKTFLDSIIDSYSEIKNSVNGKNWPLLNKLIVDYLKYNLEKFLQEKRFKSRCIKNSLSDYKNAIWKLNSEGFEIKKDQLLETYSVKGRRKKNEIPNLVILLDELILVLLFDPELIKSVTIDYELLFSKTPSEEFVSTGIDKCEVSNFSVKLCSYYLMGNNPKFTKINLCSYSLMGNNPKFTKIKIFSYLLLELTVEIVNDYKFYLSAEELLKSISLIKKGTKGVQDFFEKIIKKGFEETAKKGFRDPCFTLEDGGKIERNIMFVFFIAQILNINTSEYFNDKKIYFLCLQNRLKKLSASLLTVEETKRLPDSLSASNLTCSKNSSSVTNSTKDKLDIILALICEIMELIVNEDGFTGEFYFFLRDAVLQREYDKKTLIVAFFNKYKNYTVPANIIKQFIIFLSIKIQQSEIEKKFDEKIISNFKEAKGAAMSALLNIVKNEEKELFKNNSCDYLLKFQEFFIVIDYNIFMKEEENRNYIKEIIYELSETDMGKHHGNCELCTPHIKNMESKAILNIVNWCKKNENLDVITRLSIINRVRFVLNSYCDEIKELEDLKDIINVLVYVLVYNKRDKKSSEFNNSNNLINYLNYIKNQNEEKDTREVIKKLITLFYNTETNPEAGIENFDFSEIKKIAEKLGFNNRKAVKKTRS